jgi:hypothetical protein
MPIDTKIDIDISRLRAFEQYLLGMQDRVSDFTIPLTKGSHKIQDDVITNWNTQGAFFGQAWPEHDPDTVERHGAHSLLRQSGGLFGSIRPFAGKFTAGSYTKAPHAHLHDSGTEQFGKTHNPPRLIFYIRAETADLIMEMCGDYAVAEQQLQAV